MADSFTADSFVADSFTPDAVKAPPNPKKHPKDSLGGPTPVPDSTWGQKFTTAAGRSILENPGGINTLLHPLDSLAGIPGMVKGLATGDPATYGGMAAGAPFMLLGGGAPEGTASVLRGAGRGAWDGATAPTSLRFRGAPVEVPMPASLTYGAEGWGAGHMIPGIGPAAGAVIGASIPPIKGAIQGGMEAYRNLPKTPEVVRQPKLLGPSVHNMPGVPDPSGTPGSFVAPEYWNNPPRAPRPDVVDIPAELPRWDPSTLPPDPLASDPAMIQAVRDKQASRATQPVSQTAAPTGGIHPVNATNIDLSHLTNKLPSHLKEFPESYRSSLVDHPANPSVVAAKDADLALYLSARGITRSQFLKASLDQKNTWLRNVDEMRGKDHRPWKEGSDKTASSWARLLHLLPE